MSLRCFFFSLEELVHHSIAFIYTLDWGVFSIQFCFSTKVTTHTGLGYCANIGSMFVLNHLVLVARVHPRCVDQLNIQKTQRAPFLQRCLSNDGLLQFHRREDVVLKDMKTRYVLCI